MLEEGETDSFGIYRALGPLDEARKTDKNPRVAIDRLIAEGREKPEIYIACGLSDSLLPINRIYRDLLTEKGFKVEYIEEPGAHEWDFWDRQIKNVLDWLPLDDTESGIGSGNVPMD